LGGVGGARGVVQEERLVGHQRFLLAHPGDRLVGHVPGEVVAVLGRPPRFGPGRALLQRRVPLVALAAQEPVEVLEAVAGRGPPVVGAGRARFPHRYLVALAELGRGVTVEPQDLGQRRTGVGPHGRIAGGGGRHLGYAAHADRMVVAAAEQRRPCRRAQGGRVEPRVLEAPGGQPLGGGRAHRSSEGARSAEADVVQQHDQHVRGSGGRAQRRDGREPRLDVFGVVGKQARVAAVRDRQHRPRKIVACRRHKTPFPRSLRIVIARPSPDVGFVTEERGRARRPVPSSGTVGCVTGARNRRGGRSRPRPPHRPWGPERGPRGGSARSRHSLRRPGRYSYPARDRTRCCDPAMKRRRWRRATKRPDRSRRLGVHRASALFSAALQEC
jgi:hypothetical protein